MLRGRLLTQHELDRLGVEAEDLSSYKEVVTYAGMACHKGGMVCRRCQNQDQALMDRLPHSHQVYCRYCLNLGRISEKTRLFHVLETATLRSEQVANSLLTWQGELSAEQARAAQELIESLAEVQRPHLVYAVTGAGKTEMIFPVIAKIIQAGGRVCLASPRIDVCLELYPRLQAAFAGVAIALLYGGTEIPYGYSPLVVATTHQLYRFQHAFHLLIVDEVDAFPYVNDRHLHGAVERAIIPGKGKLIYLTATPDGHLQSLIKQSQVGLTCLPARFHGYSLPEPDFLWLGDWAASIAHGLRGGRLRTVLEAFLQIPGIKLLFLPTIGQAEALFDALSKQGLADGLACVHAKDPLRKDKVLQVRSGQLQGLVTTTILERGVTFENCHVLVIGAERLEYSASALVQIAGRVGRKAAYPGGYLGFGHFGCSYAMKEAQRQIRQMNTEARRRGLLRDGQ